MFVNQGTRQTVRTLTEDTTIYVRTDGNDSNDGTDNTSGRAFLTVQRALREAKRCDLRDNNITIQIADGTYTGTILNTGPFVGNGTVTINGNSTTPANVVLNATDSSSDVYEGRWGSHIILQNFTSGSCDNVIFCTTNSSVTVGAGMRFGAANRHHMTVQHGGSVYGRSSYTITGGANCHMIAYTGAHIDMSGLTCTLTGTPNFAGAFAWAPGGRVSAFSNTYSGAATGVRYVFDNGGTLFVNGAGTSYFPGNTAGFGTSATGGGFYA